MAASFSPLSLPAQIHDLPQNYGQIFVLFDQEGSVIAQQYLDKFNDFIDLKEVSDHEVKMRLLEQILYGEVKKWFIGLQAGSIHN